jgi:hypothetical protein
MGIVNGRRVRICLGLVLLLGITCPSASFGQAREVDLTLLSLQSVQGVSLPECKDGVYRVRVNGKITGKGEGKGTLVFDPNRDWFDEWGSPAAPEGERAPEISLECTFHFVKQYKAGAMFDLRGQKITSRMTLILLGDGGSSARLLLKGKDDKVRTVIELSGPLYEPCHPGCFPAKTPVRVASGYRNIETLRMGDRVMTLNQNGTWAEGEISHVFLTRNVLLEVETDSGLLTTTLTQPLLLAEGGYKAAGELKAGDQICKWENDAKHVVTVNAVKKTGVEATVFNLVLGDPVVFVAGDFMARSKPPVVAP